MIKSINITNFQVHRSLDLDFHPGVNVIVGESDTGKSTVIRALDWVISNNPVDHSMRSWDSKKTEVTIETDDHKITRTKSASINTYDLDGQIYKAFGHNVPDDIKKAFNFGEVNFRYQLDAPYLLTLNPGEVARKLNKAVDLDRMGEAISNVNRETKKAESELSDKQVSLEPKEKEVESLAWAEKADYDLIIMEQLAQTIRANKTQQAKAEELLSEAYDLKEENKPLLNIAQAKDEIKKLKNTLENIKVTKEIINDADAKLDNIFDLQDEVEQTKKIVKAEPEIQKLLNMKEKIDINRRIVDDARLALKIIDGVRLENNNLKKDIDSIKKKMPKICPLCQGKGKLK